MKKYSGIIKIIVLLILLPIIVWELGLKKTYLVYQEANQAEAEMLNVKNSYSHQPVPIIQAPSPLLSNGKLLELITDHFREYQVEIVSCNPALINEDKDYKLYSATLVLRGEFINLVKLIRTIEKKDLPIKLSSINFSYKPSKGKEMQIRKIELTLIFQQLEG